MVSGNGAASVTIFKGYGHLSDDERARQFVAHMNRTTLLTALRGLTMDEAIQAWFDAQAESGLLDAAGERERYARRKAAQNIERQVQA